MSVSSRARPAVAIATIAVVTALGVPSSAVGATSSSATRTPRGPTVIDGRDASGKVVGASDALRTVPVTGTAYAGPGAALVAADHADQAARDEATAAHAELTRLQGESQNTAADLADDDADIAALRARHDSETQAVVDISVRRYVDGPSTAWMDPALSPEVLAQDQSTRSDLRNASAQLARRLSRTSSTLSQAVAARARHAGQDSDLKDAIAKATDRATLADAAAVRTAAARQSAFDAEGAARLGTTVAGTDLTLVALDAYWRAANAEVIAHPLCRLTWYGLAAIGETESHHGGARQPDGSAALGIDGLPVARILGPPLDGTNGTRLIPDSEGGWIDGNPLVDRAVGPMQFLPGTWRTHGMDGSGDGVADLDNLYDATRSAADYLCQNGIGLDGDQGLTTAYTAYAGAAPYAAVALAHAHDYQAAVALPGNALIALEAAAAPPTASTDTTTSIAPLVQPGN